MPGKNKRVNSLAVLESNFGRSPLYVLEEAARGEIEVLYWGDYKETEEGKWLHEYFAINAEALLRIIREIGIERAFSEELEFEWHVGSKIFSGNPSEGSINASPARLRLKENLFVSLGDLQKLKNSEDTRSLNSNQSHPYSVPQGTPWSKITITFHGGDDGLDTDFVKLKAPNMDPQPFRYSQLGFNDSRNDKPDSFWNLLLEFAKSKGEIKIDSDKRGAIKDLRKLLKNITGLTDNPIYSIGNGTYKTMFTIQYNVKEDAEDRLKPSLAEQEIASINLPQRNRRPGS